MGQGANYFFGVIFDHDIVWLWALSRNGLSAFVLAAAQWPVCLVGPPIALRLPGADEHLGLNRGVREGRPVDSRGVDGEENRRHGHEGVAHFGRELEGTRHGAAAE